MSHLKYLMGVPSERAIDSMNVRKWGGQSRHRFWVRNGHQNRPRIDLRIDEKRALWPPLLFTLTTFYRLYYYQTRPGSPPKANAGPRSLPNAYSPTLMPQSLFNDAMSPFGMSPYATSLFYDRSRGPTSPTYSPTSPGLNLTSLGYSPTSPRYLAFIFTYITSV